MKRYRPPRALFLDMRQVYRAWKAQRRFPALRERWLDALLVAVARRDLFYAGRGRR